jgi:hypothetical protein
LHVIGHTVRVGRNFFEQRVSSPALVATFGDATTACNIRIACICAVPSPACKVTTLMATSTAPSCTILSENTSR